MLEKVLIHIHNWFESDVIVKDWEITGGSLDLPHLQSGQYFRIVGSVFNEGLHQYPADDLKDEAFTGGVWALAIPKALLDIVSEIEAWEEKNGEASESPYSSESFGGYSYTIAGANDATDGLSGWQRAFRSKLSPWRKL